MATNTFFRQGSQSEQNLYESLFVEAIQMYGQDVYYLPRTVVSKIDLLGEPSQSQFNSYHPIEMYVDSVDGFEGGDFFQKFGIEIRDSLKFVVSKSRWKTEIGNMIGKEMPDIGDIIFHPQSGAFLEIKFTEDEKPFYSLNTLMEYKMDCELFEYGGEVFNTGLYEIDKIEYELGSGGTKMIVSINTTPTPEMNRVTLGETYTQGTTTCKLYSITPKEGSPLLYDISVGQITGIFHESDSSFLIGNDSGLSFKIETIYDIDNSTEDEQLFPTDVQTDNVDIETEADDIISFDESNPFGNM